MSDTEATLAALEAASANVREANQAAHQAPATPESLYARNGEIVELLGRLRQATERLSAQVDDTTAAAHAEGALLDTDDGQPAGEYVDEARLALLRAAAEIDDALRLANQAWSALSHLKFSDL
jgi:hypothetical protein